MTRWGLPALMAVTALVYAPSLDGGFVWDDVLLVRDNPNLRSFDTALAAAFGDFFRQAGTSQPASGYLRPVPTLLNAATWAVFGAAPLPFRLTNLALHLAAVALALAFLRRTGFGRAGALAGATVFALHPMQAEAVAFISGRTDLLAAVFGLASMLAYLRAREHPSKAWPVLVIVFLVLGSLSKEVVWMLPAVLLVIERAGLAPGSHNRRLVWVCAGIVVMMALPRVWGEGVPRMYFPPSDLPLVVPNLTATYLGWTLVPLEPRALHDDLEVARFGWTTVAGLSVLAGLAWAAVRVRTRAGLAAALFVAFLLPVLHLVALPTLAAERYLYLPLLGAGAFVGLAFAVPHRAVVVGGLVACVFAGRETALRAVQWRDELTLWSAEVVHGGGFKAYQNLGTALAEAGRTAEATRAFEVASQLRPGHPLVFRNLVRLRARSLPPEVRDGFLADALSDPPDRERLAGWPPRLEPHDPELAARVRAHVTSLSRE